jgi:two-component system, cell cycle response regulator
MHQAIPSARARRAAAPAAARRGSHRRAASVCPDRLSRALARRAPRMAAHQRAVANLAGIVGRRIGLQDDELNAVVRAAEFHDVGKILVPDAILNKPGPLTEDELAVLRRHAVAGERILAGAAEPDPIPRLVRASHERWDGSGYPDGLRGEDIPLGARIIAICDAYDAMTHERPYRPARSAAEALDELRLGAGVRYDPGLVAVFVAAVAARSDG